jgi:hypothetical protein
MAKINPFRHLHQHRSEEEHKVSPLAKKVSVLLFALFLLLFPQYVPWEPNYEQSDTLAYKVFTLYFFIIN